MESPVSRVYAQALVELGERHGNLERLVEEFDAFAGLWKESALLHHVLGSPAIHRGQKIRLIGRICAKEGLTDLFRRFLSVLAAKARLGILDQIHASFTRMIEERRGIVRARATFAICMEERLVSELEAALSTKLDKKVTLWVTRDPSILGGMVLSVGDRLIDMSLRNRLEQFRRVAAGAS